MSGSSLTYKGHGAGSFHPSYSIASRYSPSTPKPATSRPAARRTPLCCMKPFNCLRNSPWPAKLGKVPSEGEHDHAAAGGTAAGHRGDQNAVDQATGHPAPQRSQGESLWHRTHRKQLFRVGLQALPDDAAEALSCTTKWKVGQIQAQNTRSRLATSTGLV